jgi:Ca-activated chloride channel homolog
MSWMMVMRIIRAWFITAALAANLASAATPSGSEDAEVPTFRATTGEVHLSVTAVAAHHRIVDNLASGDVELFCDGLPVSQVSSLEPRHNLPATLIVLTDVSDSMSQGIELERSAAGWLKAHVDVGRDRALFRDFDSSLQAVTKMRNRAAVGTSLYDAAFKAISELASDAATSRRALILLTDGDDNSSSHGLGDVIDRANRYDVAIYTITVHQGRDQVVREDVLTSLSAETGGRSYRVRNNREMLAAVREINEDLRNGFDLVFRPEDTTPGKHEIVIKPRNKSLRVFYRSSYFQPELPNSLLR